MFNEDPVVFLNDFGTVFYYRNGSVAKNISAIIDHDVEFVGENGELAGRSITLTMESDESVVIGGTFKANSIDYAVDFIVSDDGVIKVVSVVKQ
ncbi:MAG: hypothetical protein ACN4GM_13280 [Gammaproteobacteria bacterium]